jgi:zinc-ribbon domain
MFCDKCGASIGSGAQFCSSCGKSVGSVPAGGAPVATSVGGVAGGGAGAVRTADDGRVQRHIQILASLWLANGILRFAEVGSIFIAGQMLPFLMGWGIPGHAGNWPFNFLPFGLYSIGGLLAFFGIAYIILAWGLFQREPWARGLGLVLGILSLLRPPFGTALGIYTLWVLLPERSSQEYERLSRAYPA